MSYADEAATIRTRFAELWAARTPVAYENTTFKPPKNPAGEPLPWVRLTVLTGEALQADMSEAPRYRHPGAVMVQVFTRHGTGDAEARELADQAAAIFRRFSVGGLVFRTPYITVVGSDGTFYQVNAVCPFFRDSTF